MRSFLYLAIVTVVLSFGGEANAQPTWDHVGTRFNIDGCGTPGCLTSSQFRTNRTCTSLGGSWGPTSGWCVPDKECIVAFKYGRNPANTYLCCEFDNICNAAGERLPEEEVQSIMAKHSEDRLDEVFSMNQSEVHWGYYNGTIRSPNNGRTISAGARLDVCLNYTDVDALGSGYTAWNNCKTSTTVGCLAANKNEHCMNNNAAVCVDRCDCYFTGFGSCENL